MVNSQITLKFLNLIVNTPQALNAKGGMLYLSSVSGTTTMTINSVTINNPSAADSGGTIYLTGVNAVLNSDTLVVNNARALAGDGGVYHFENSGYSTSTHNHVTYDVVYSKTSGGIGSYTGTNV